MFLQNTQQGDLRLARKLSDFIEEDRASFSHQARRSIPGADRGCYSVKYDRQDWSPRRRTRLGWCRHHGNCGCPGALANTSWSIWLPKRTATVSPRLCAIVRHVDRFPKHRTGFHIKRNITPAKAAHGYAGSSARVSSLDERPM